MRAPSRIALFGAGGVILASFLTSAGGQLLRKPQRIYEIANVTGFAAAEAIFVGALVWVGTYIGARLAAANQRTDRLVRVLVLTYAAIAILLSLPIETHWVVLDVSPGSSGMVQGTDWSQFVLVFGAPVAVVVLFAVITRVLAAALRGKTSRDA
jgi:hypothetical protein